MAGEPFRPASWLPGPHWQTIAGRLLRSRRHVEFRRERIDTPDGDFLDLDWVTASRNHEVNPSWPILVCLHGLEGSARSNYMLELYRAAVPQRLAPVGLNFRSCSGEMNRRSRLYHSGETGDLATVLRHIHQAHGAKKIFAAGFSLGGNVLLKYLGENGRAGREVTLRGAVAVSVPFDLSAGADFVERGFSRVYSSYLIRKLRRKVRAKAQTLNSEISVSRTLRARTFREFDDLATAPLHGFQGAEDYYRRSSSRELLRYIRIPVRLIHSRDDPFLPESAIPREVSDTVSWSLTDRGGHVGFVSGTPWRPIFWAERRTAEFLASIARGL